jgi:hypothetical protein
MQQRQAKDLQVAVEQGQKWKIEQDDADQKYGDKSLTGKTLAHHAPR